MTGDRPTGAFTLLCRARMQSCALPLPHVLETMRPLPIVPLAGAAAFVCGVSLVRGEPTPVVDVGALLGASSPPSFTRFVTVSAGERRMALAFEAVMHVHEWAPESLATLPPLLRGVSDSAVSSVAVLDAELLLVLEGARCVPDAYWPMLDGLPR